MKRIFIFFLFSLSGITVLLSGTEIRHSGTIGQSRPERTLDFIGVTGLVSVNGKFYFWSAPQLYSFSTPDDIAPAVHLGGHCRQLFSDGKDIWLKNGTGTVFKLERAAGKERFRPILKLDQPARPFAAVPEKQERKGWGRRLKLALLLQDKVVGYDANGNYLGKVLDLPKNEIYHSIAFLPESGDMLVAVPYPKCQVFRFKPDGSGFQWKYRQHLTDMFPADGKVFGADTRLQEIPESFKPGTAKPRTNRDDMIISGVASAPGGGYYLGTSQGIIHYPANPAASPVRIGGFPGCHSLAVNDDGTVLALSDHNRTLVYGMKIDDAPASPLSSSANPTSAALWNPDRFRKGNALAVSASARDFYVLNRNGNKTELWKFSPCNYRTKMPVWQKLNPAHSDISAIGSSENGVYLLSNSTIIQLENGKEKQIFSEFPIEKFAVSEDGLALYGNSALTFLKRTADGKFKQAWRIRCGKVRGMAVNENGVLLSLPGKLALHEISGGGKKAELALKGYSGGAVAMKGRWIFAADRNKKSIERYKIEE